MVQQKSMGYSLHNISKINPNLEMSQKSELQFKTYILRFLPNLDTSNYINLEPQKLSVLSVVFYTNPQF